jgi:hypothetical protein
VQVNIPTSAFVSLGGALNTTSNQRFLGRRSIAIDASGNPVVVWSELKVLSAESGTLESDSFVKKWTGQAWAALGGGLAIHQNPYSNSQGAEIALDSSGNPTVVWEESGFIYVKKYNGTGWDFVGSTFLNVKPNPSASSPSLALDSSGNPTVAWDEYDGTSTHVYVKKYNGTGWSLVGSTYLDVKPGEGAYSPSLALDSSGNPTVAWNEYGSTSRHVYVKKYNGNNWSLVGNTFLGVNIDIKTRSPLLALDSSGNPTIAWSENQETIYVKKYNGSQWNFLNSTTLDQKAQLQSLALDPNGNPLVSYINISNDGVGIYVKRWDGTTWKAMGTGLVDVIYSFPTAASLALDAAGNPTVAWSKVSSYLDDRVYVKRFVP